MRRALFAFFNTTQAGHIAEIALAIICRQQYNSILGKRRGPDG
jgi:hypothetical protein